MNKKLLILAVTGALTASMGANADSSNVTIYGRLFPQFNVLKSDGATPVGTPVSDLAPGATGVNEPRHNEVDANSSRIGVRGTEDLGDGLKAVWQIESRVRADTGTGRLGDRDSHVGLAGGFGTVIYGIWRAPFRYLAGAEAFLGVSQSSIVSPTNIMATPGLDGDGSESFHRREPNSVQYWSPALGGLSFRVAYSPDEAKTATKDRNLVSTGVAYEAGPVYVGLGYEVHNDFFGGSNAAGFANGTSSKDTGTRAVVTLTLGDTKVSLARERLQYKESGGAVGGFERYERDATALYAQQKIGKFTVAVAWNQADEGKCTLVAATCSTAELGAMQTAVGAKYSFSKRTEVFAYYTQLKNDASASYTITDLVSPGTDFSAVALGINYTF